MKNIIIIHRRVFRPTKTNPFAYVLFDEHRHTKYRSKYFEKDLLTTHTVVIKKEYNDITVTEE